MVLILGDVVLTFRVRVNNFGYGVLLLGYVVLLFGNVLVVLIFENVV